MSKSLSSHEAPRHLVLDLLFYRALLGCAVTTYKYILTVTSITSTFHTGRVCLPVRHFQLANVQQLHVLRAVQNLQRLSRHGRVVVDTQQPRGEVDLSQLHILEGSLYIPGVASPQAHRNHLRRFELGQLDTVTLYGLRLLLIFRSFAFAPLTIKSDLPHFQIFRFRFHLTHLR